MAKKRGALASYFHNIWVAVKSVSIGMGITMRAFLKTNGLLRKKLKGYDYGTGPVTISYPETKDELPKGTRNRLFNHVEGCISCNQCAVVCPVDCITIESRKKRDDEDKSAKTPPEFGNKPMKLKLLRFDIDEALCCFCGLCTETCPTQSIVHTSEYEYSKFDRDALKYDYLNFKDDNPLPRT